MSDFITAITNSTSGITSATLWGDVTSAAPLIVLVTTFAFGYYVVRKLVKGTSKGKVRM